MVISRSNLSRTWLAGNSIFVSSYVMWWQKGFVSEDFHLNKYEKEIETPKWKRKVLLFTFGSSQFHCTELLCNKTCFKNATEWVIQGVPLANIRNCLSNTLKQSKYCWSMTLFFLKHEQFSYQTQKLQWELFLEKIFV